MDKITLLASAISAALVISGCGGSSESGTTEVTAPEETTTETPDETQDETPTPEPDPDPQPEQPDATEIARAGNIDGVRVWRLPDSPEGDAPDQCWLAVGSSPDGSIYISGHDHISNSMLYRLGSGAEEVVWVGDARTASLAADNWQAGETAEKFHTRPTAHNDKVYVATLDYSAIDNGYAYTRGFHWYAYQPEDASFVDLSATEDFGVGAPHRQIVTIQVDPQRDVMYGMSIGDNQLVAYDIEQGQTEILGRPNDWQGYFYSNRFMWIDSRSKLYITGGSSRLQWYQGEDSEVFDHVWAYHPEEGFSELPEYALQGPNAMEVGQWDRQRQTLYTADDQGFIYKFEDATEQFEYIGRAGFYTNFKTWVFQVSADEQKIYIGASDQGPNENAIWEFDIATGESIELAHVTELDSQAGTENFITGYDSWDDQGRFYISSFSMYDNDNVLMLGIDPVRLKVAQGILPELVTVNLERLDDAVTVSRSGSTASELEVLYDVLIFDAEGELNETIQQAVTVNVGNSSASLSFSQLTPAYVSAEQQVTVQLVNDGNDYIVGTQRTVSR